MSKLTYAKAGGPPHDWHNLEIVRKSDGAHLDHVLEADAEAGRIVRYATDARGKFIGFRGEYATEVVSIEIEILRRRDAN